MATKWLPIESNPQVMNKFLPMLGISGSYSFVDVFGLDEDLLAFVPQPVKAVILLFPLSEKEDEFKEQQEQGITAAGQDASNKIFFMKQYVGNACGTIAMIHSIANNASFVTIGDGSMKKFLKDTAGKTPDEIGHHLETFEGIAEAHEKLAKEGQTSAPAIDEKVEPHFICFVNVKGNLYELDGRKKFPINHGATSNDSFLADSAGICRSFMERNPDENRFAVIALAPKQD